MAEDLEHVRRERDALFEALAYIAEERTAYDVQAAALMQYARNALQRLSASRAARDHFPDKEDGK